MARSLRSLTHSLTPYKLIAFSLSFLLIFGCKNEITVNIKKPAKTEEASTNLNVTVSNIQVINHQVVITGTNLTAVNNFEIKDGNAQTALQIESKTATTIIANTLSNVTFAAGKILDFIFANAHAQSVFQVNFSLCDSTLGGAGFNCSITPNDKEVLAYDANSQQWRPRAVNGLSYKGAWDANDPEPVTADADSGDYYIVSVANPPTYDVGDWIVFNGTAYDLIDNSQAIVSVAGKTGAVTLNLSDLTNIALTAPTIGQVLRFNGTNWVNNTFTVAPETDPTVKTFAQHDLPTCGVNQVLKSNGSVFSCVTDQTGAGAFTGTANRAVVTDGSGALTASSITDTVLGYLSGVTSNIQTQLNSKLGTSFGLGNGNKVMITDALGDSALSTTTTTELGYLSGVTSNIQTQLNSKLGSFTETDPHVSAFAKSALPNCAATGEILTSDGTSFGCVDDDSGAGVYTGTQDRLVLTNGTTGELTTSAITNTEAGYLSGVTSNIQTQLNNKQNAGKISTNTEDAGSIHPFGTNAGDTGEFRFYELVANGSDYTGFKAPDDLANNIIYTLPQLAPTNGQVLSSTDAGVMSWISIPSAPVVSVNGEVGTVVLSTTDIAEGINEYFTVARAKSAAVADSITDAVTDVAPSQNAVYDALALKLNSGSFVEWDQSGLTTIHPSRLNLSLPNASKAVVTDGAGFIIAGGASATEVGYLSGVTSNIQTQLNSKQGTIGNGDITNAHLAGSIAQSKITNLSTDLAAKQNTSTLASDVRSIALTGLSTATNAVITATDSILSAFGKLQKQITDLDSAALKKTGGTLTVGTISGVPNPSANDQVANKAYVDSATGSLNPQTPSDYSPSCPTGYISVPAIPYYPGPSFCVMKWEAKTGDGSTAATTAAAGNPKVSISRDTARTACRLIGPGYDLISNAQWQTIARNIADQAGNWSTGTAYSGELNRGHSDATPNNSLAAVADDTDACNGTGQTCSNTVWDSQRRTHSLSNGEVIWDFAGNVWEWVTDNSVTAALGSNQYISTQRAGGRTQIQYGNDQFCATPDSSPYCGMGYGYFNYTAGAVLRGGSWNFDVNSGVFATLLSNAPSNSYTSFGFRCVFVP